MNKIENQTFNRAKLLIKKKDAFLTSLLWSLDTVRGVKENTPATTRYPALSRGCFPRMLLLLRRGITFASPKTFVWTVPLFFKLCQSLPLASVSPP